MHFAVVEQISVARTPWRRQVDSRSYSQDVSRQMDPKVRHRIHKNTRRTLQPSGATATDSGSPGFKTWPGGLLS
jgi:hypothetical protein